MWKANNDLDKLVKAIGKIYWHVHQPQSVGAFGMKPSDLRLNGTIIRYDATVMDPMEPNLFDVSWLHANQFWQGSSTGRSKAHFFRYADTDMVLRHFHRGGLMGRINRDLYLRVDASKSRPLLEFDLLCEMRAEGLPVPSPVAARYVPFGPFYRADIITQRIPDARPLQDIIVEKTLSPKVWSAIGAEVRNLHNHGVFHSDLNCRNIMMDTRDKVWFIDFDKCEKRTPGQWTQANLERLRRSLRKTANENPALHWREEDWDELLSGYTDTA